MQSGSDVAAASSNQELVSSASSESDVAVAGIIQPAAEMAADLLSSNQQDVSTDEEPVYCCCLKKMCTNQMQKELHKCLHCDKRLHVDCAAKIRPVFKSRAKKQEEKVLNFDMTDIICSKACYNKMVKVKLLPSDSVPGGTPTRFWHSDGRTGPTDPTNSLSVLMNWFTTEGNYSQWRGGDKHSGQTKKQ